MHTAYPAKFRLDTDGAYVVSFPDVPEAHTFFEDKADAHRLAAEALAAALSFYVEKGKPLPVPSAQKRGQVLIHLATATIAKLALYEAMREQGVTQSELARRLGCHRQHAARIVDPAHNTNFETLEAALHAIGLRLAVSIERTAA